MAALTFISNSLSSITSLTSSSCSSTHNHKPSSLPLTVSLFHCDNLSQRAVLELGSQNQWKKKCRGSSVITNAGPSSTSYIFAFIFPISLIAVTIFTSIRIADDLDRKFLEELAVNQEILEEILESEEGDADPISLEEKPEVPRKRNRPKREVEASSM